MMPVLFQMLLVPELGGQMFVSFAAFSIPQSIRQWSIIGWSLGNLRQLTCDHVIIYRVVLGQHSGNTI